MKKIQMVDLQGQYLKIKKQVDIAIEQVLGSSAYINGEYVKDFQSDLEKYLNVKHVIPCANGTDALQVALMSLNLNPGDEVITADFTFAATVEVISLLGLTPVLVDVCPDTFNINTEALQKAITPKTKAIIPVHLFGQCADMESILEIANAHKLHVIEDNAQAIGADYIFKDGIRKKAGTLGNIGTTSFFPSKNLGAYGDGGAIFTDDDQIAHKLKGIVNHGMYRRYYHDVVGVNSRLDSIQAAVLKTKLPLLDSYAEARRSAATYYSDAFANHPNIIVPTISNFSTHVFHQYTIQITNGRRDQLHKHLLDNKIPNAIYYPVPLHRQKAYHSPRYDESDFKTTNELVNRIISLPMHTELSDEQLRFITETVLDFL